MADRRKVPNPPHLMADGRTFTPAMIDWIAAIANDEAVAVETNVGSTVSGIASSLAVVDQKAVQAKAAANSAAAGVNTLTATVAAGGGTGFSATVSPVSAYGSEAGPAVIASNSVTVTPTGGVAPYSYSWALGVGTTITINSAAAATTGFTSIGSVPPWTAYEDTATCTVTDSTGGTPLTTQVSLNVTLYATGTGDIP